MVDQAKIHRKAVSGDVEERREAAEQLIDNFADLPDKNEAWGDLIRLTQDENVWRYAAGALGHVFQYVPDKTQAWDDLHWLTQDQDWYVRLGAANSLGHAFPHVPDKNHAWEDLHRLTKDEIGDVRASANHSRGRAFIFKATEAEGSDDFKSELKKRHSMFREIIKGCGLFQSIQFLSPVLQIVLHDNV